MPGDAGAVSRPGCGNKTGGHLDEAAWRPKCTGVVRGGTSVSRGKRLDLSVDVPLDGGRAGAEKRSEGVSEFARKRLVLRFASLTDGEAS